MGTVGNLHLISKYKSLLLTLPCVLAARHMYCPWVCFDMLCSTSDWLVMIMPRDECMGLLLWYHSIFFIGGLASMRHSRYTSVPLAKFFGSKFDPSDNVTMGASAEGDRKRKLFRNWLHNEANRPCRGTYAWCPIFVCLLSTTLVHCSSPRRAPSMQWLCHCLLASGGKRCLMLWCCRLLMAADLVNWKSLSCEIDIVVTVCDAPCMVCVPLVHRIWGTGLAPAVEHDKCTFTPDVSAWFSPWMWMYNGGTA